MSVDGHEEALVVAEITSDPVMTARRIIALERRIKALEEDLLALATEAAAHPLRERIRRRLSAG